MDEDEYENWMKEDEAKIFLKPKLLKQALLELPIQNITDDQANDLYDVYINDLYSLLKHNNNYYFVDSQDFSYPRYVLRIDGLN